MLDAEESETYNVEVRKPKRDKLAIVVALLLVANITAIVFFTIDFNLQVSRLDREMELLKFQHSSTNFELSSLKEELKLLRLGNNSESLLQTQVYNATRRSVVLIKVTTLTGSGQGSGFVYDTEGRIITNNHVVENSLKIEVTFIDGTTVQAKLVGRDPYSDLAVVDVDVDPSILYPLRLGDSSELVVGETVVAIGNPYGLASTMTLGIVSALGRQMEAPAGYAIVDVIQTDAAINPGNSGGPLLNLKGEVVGMNTAIISETRQFSGIGFAIPSNTIAREVPSLISKGSYSHPYLGIQGMDLTPAIAEAMGLDKKTKGALITTVVPGGPAEKAGLRGGTMDVAIEGTTVRIGGDVILGVENNVVKNLYDLIVYMERYKKPGDSVNMKILRSNSIIDVQVILGERPPP
ncbi:trypsin-like peptidase domain-containing protein [Candidatus Bathyarchaeota archaeon]|nr:trypsin-like peptidase domain-containing protein [Candidatus Bathyarchaeota archaeon]